VEQALNEDLRDSPQIGPGARAQLRAGAHGVDLAEDLARPDLIAKAILAYLDVRRAYGLAGGTAEPVDPFAAFVAGLSAPSVGHPTDP
jgi:hypothetical protein